MLAAVVHKRAADEEVTPATEQEAVEAVKTALEKALGISSTEKPSPDAQEAGMGMSLETQPPDPVQPRPWPLGHDMLAAVVHKRVADEEVTPATEQEAVEAVKTALEKALGISSTERPSPDAQEAATGVSLETQEQGKMQAGIGDHDHDIAGETPDDAPPAQDQAEAAAANMDGTDRLPNEPASAEPAGADSTATQRQLPPCPSGPAPAAPEDQAEAAAADIDGADQLPTESASVAPAGADSTAVPRQLPPCPSGPAPAAPEDCKGSSETMDDYYKKALKSLQWKRCVHEESRRWHTAKLWKSKESARSLLQIGSRAQDQGMLKQNLRDILERKAEATKRIKECDFLLARVNAREARLRRRMDSQAPGTAATTCEPKDRLQTGRSVRKLLRFIKLRAREDAKSLRELQASWKKRDDQLRLKWERQKKEARARAAEQAARLGETKEQRRQLRKELAAAHYVKRRLAAKAVAQANAAEALRVQHEAEEKERRRRQAREEARKQAEQESRRRERAREEALQRIQMLLAKSRGSQAMRTATSRISRAQMSRSRRCRKFWISNPRRHAGRARAGVAVSTTVEGHPGQGRRLTPCFPRHCRAAPGKLGSTSLHRLLFADGAAGGDQARSSKEDVPLLDVAVDDGEAVEDPVALLPEGASSSTPAPQEDDSKNVPLYRRWAAKSPKERLRGQVRQQLRRQPDDNSSFMSWAVVAFVVFALMAAAACFIWPQAATFVGTLSDSNRAALLGVAASLCFMVLIGGISPLLNGTGYVEAVKWGALKTLFMVKIVFLAVGFYYADIGTDMISLGAFWSKTKFQYFTTNLLGMILAAAYFSHIVFTSVDGGLRFRAMLAVAAAAQLLPLGCLLIALYWFLLADSEARLKSCLPLIPILLAASSMAESLIEAFFGACVQTYSYIHDDWGDDIRSALRTSIIISVLSLAKGYAELDDEDKVLRSRSGRPTLTGSAPKGSCAFVAVAVQRLLAVSGRLILPGIFQEITHESLKVEYSGHAVAVGALLFISLDWAVQSILVMLATGNPGKLGWSFANVVAPVEPLLHRGEPVLSTLTVYCAAAHWIEAVVALLIGYCLSDSFHSVDFETKNIDVPLCCVGVLCALLQLPALLCVRHLFAYDGEKEKTWLHIVDPTQNSMDNADFNAPIAYYVSKIPDESKKKVLASIVLGDDPEGVHLLNLHNSDLADFEVQAIAKALEQNKTLKDLYMGGTQIGTDGAKALAEALKHNTVLKLLNLEGNKIGPDGAKAIAEALKTNKTLQKLFVGSNNIGDGGAKAIRVAWANRSRALYL